MSHPPAASVAPPPAMHRRPSQAQARLDAINQRTSPSRLRAAQQRAATMPHGGARSAEEAAAMMLLPHALVPSSPPPPQLSLLQLHHQRLAAERDAALRAQARAQMAPEYDEQVAQAGAHRSQCVCSPGAPYCNCGAAVPSASSAAAAATSAASSNDAIASPASSTSSASSSASSVLHRGAAWARSASKLRSTILSAYALWKWATGEDAPHHSAGAAAAIDVVSPSASAAASGMRSVASSSALRGMAHRGFSSSSPLSLKTLLPLLRRYIRTLIFLARFYSRSFHRFLRPHLLLLLRSRALTRLVSISFPFLRRHLFLLGHALFVWSSAIIIVKRYLPPAVGEAAAAQVGIVGGMAASVRGQMSAALMRWGSWSVFRRLVYSASFAGSFFLLYTCVQIVREHLRRRRKAMAERLARRTLETAAVLESQGGSWSPEELAAFAAMSLAHAPDSPYVSPEPSPDPTPAMSPSTSHAELSWLEVAARYPEDELELQQQHPQHQQHANTATRGPGEDAGVHDAPPAPASISASAAVPLSPSPPPALFVTPPRTSAFIAVASSSAAVTPSSATMSLHPLASSLASRMEWSPADAGTKPADASDAAAAAAPVSSVSFSSHSFSPSHPVGASGAAAPPGAPLAHPPPSSLSFISPASHRLTQIRIEQHARNPAAARAMRVQAQRILDNIEPDSVPLPVASSSAPPSSSPSPPPATTGFLPSLRNLFR